jgi:hypothetical protein
MKKILFVCAVMLVTYQSVFCQEAERKVTIQTSPLLLFSEILVSDPDDLFIMDLEGQFKINNNSNISITLSFLYGDYTFSSYDYDYVNDISEDYSYREIIFQVGLKPMYIYRPFGTGLKGFFIGFYPNADFQYSITSDNNSAFYTNLGFGLDLGYKWIFDSGFTMQVGGGIGKTFSIPPKTNHDGFINSDGRITIRHTDISILSFKLGCSF